MSENIRDAINWWEDDLNSEDRNKIMGNKSWSDIGENNPEGIKKRHKWLLMQYKRYKNKYPKN